MVAVVLCIVLWWCPAFNYSAVCEEPANAVMNLVSNAILPRPERRGLSRFSVSFPPQAAPRSQGAADGCLLKRYAVMCHATFAVCQPALLSNGDLAQVGKGSTGVLVADVAGRHAA